MNFVKKFDIKTAFLHGISTDEVFMEKLEGYEKKEYKMCVFRKALYGLKQAPMTWYEHFTNFLKYNAIDTLLKRVYLKTKVEHYF